MLDKLAKKPLIGLVLASLLIAISVPIQQRIDLDRGKFRSIQQSLYLSSSSLKRVSLGYTEVLADIYWIRALQYFGGNKQSEQKPELLYHYFDIITDLDPKFVNAYRYGGTFLAENPPYGLGDLDKGIELFNKGRKNNPDNYRLPLEEAFIYYLNQKNYNKAAELFEEASEKPGLSPFRQASIKGMAASALNQGGNRDLSKHVWTIIYNTSPSESRSAFAKKNLDVLRTKDIEDELTKSLEQYIETHQQLPKNIGVLLDLGLIKKMPAAPVGGKYFIAPKIRAIRNSTVAKEEIRHNIGFLNAKSQRFNTLNKKYANDLNELREYIQSNTTADYPSHPLGEKYEYNPETGKVSSQLVLR